MAPLLLATLTPFVKDLFANGLSMLGNAVAQKGKQYVEKELGVTLPPEGQPISPDKLVELRQLEFDHEERLREIAVREIELDIEREKNASSAVTQRWQADMLSDSWLSKNIRPMVLIALLTTYFMFAMLSGFDFYINTAYVELLGQMLMMAMTAYFAGRTVEKIVDMKERGKQ
jgi:hypothetical protein